MAGRPIWACHVSIHYQTLLDFTAVRRGHWTVAQISLSLCRRGWAKMFLSAGKSLRLLWVDPCGSSGWVSQLRRPWRCDVAAGGRNLPWVHCSSFCFFGVCRWCPCISDVAVPSGTVPVHQAHWDCSRREPLSTWWVLIKAGRLPL